MIKSITMRNVASYSSSVQQLENLQRVNVIYGANGSGKSTISRYLAQHKSQTANVDYVDCNLERQASSHSEVLVYNEDFITQNFRQTDELKGIFTLGEDNVEADAQIKSLQEEVERVQKKILSAKTLLNGEDATEGALQQRKQLEDEFEKELWRRCESLRDELPEVFRGLRNSREKFKDAVLAKYETIIPKTSDVDALQRDYGILFAEEHTTTPTFSTLNFQALTRLESSSLLQKQIVGTSNSTLNVLIDRLDNRGWVTAGMTFHAKTEHKKCPFCQQDTKQDLRRELEEVFDEVYQTDIAAVYALFENYKSESSNLMNEVNTFIESESLYWTQHKESLLDLKAKIQEVFHDNEKTLASKTLKPSEIKALKSSKSILENINKLIQQVNCAIARDNEKLSNLKQEKGRLKEATWSLLLYKHLTYIEDFTNENTKRKNKIDGLNTAIEHHQKEVEQKNAEIRRWEEKRTSVQGTVDKINGILREYGFTNFYLKVTAESSTYEILRSNGENAKDTLSEGEKTFLVFLYFYYLVEGSFEETGQTTPRIVVFDDPVSSLDSQVLFIVSTLIRRLCRIAVGDPTSETGGPQVRQVFIFTHNLYFHKEVTFSHHRKISPHFWLIRKHENHSRIEAFGKENPIKSSYQLLWQDIQAVEASQCHTIRNTMRRILEHYFVHLGTSSKLRDLEEKFKGTNKYIYQTLVSWLNDGSHAAFDDLHYNRSNETIDMYRAVFRDIFEKSGHIGHYDMMMNSSN